jgi:hypothetical protein
MTLSNSRRSLHDYIHPRQASVMELIFHSSSSSKSIAAQLGGVSDFGVRIPPVSIWHSIPIGVKRTITGNKNFISLRGQIESGLWSGPLLNLPGKYLHLLQLSGYRFCFIFRKSGVQISARKTAYIS